MSEQDNKGIPTFNIDTGSDTSPFFEEPKIDPEIETNPKESIVAPQDKQELQEEGDVEEVKDSEEGSKLENDIDKVLKGSEEDLEKEIEEESKKEEDRFSSKFAALSRREKQIRERERQIEQRQKEFEERQGKLKDLESLEEKILANPLKWLEEKGVDFNTLSEMQLNELEPTPEMMYKRLEQKFESQLEEKTKELREQYLKEKEEEAERKYEQTINSFMEEITDFVNTQEEEYELIKANDSVQAVYDVIEQYHAKTGKILEVKEAADYVESHLYEEAQKLLKLRKLQAKKEAEADKKVDDKKSDKKTQVTLSNEKSTQVPSRTNRLMSNEESLAEAAKLIQWDE